jgi:hypothetical protein
MHAVWIVANLSCHCSNVSNTTHLEALVDSCVLLCRKDIQDERLILGTYMASLL